MSCTSLCNMFCHRFQTNFPPAKSKVSLNQAAHHPSSMARDDFFFTRVRIKWVTTRQSSSFPTANTNPVLRMHKHYSPSA